MNPHEDQRRQVNENAGLPSLSLDTVQGIAVPIDWDIADVLGDIVMAELADENPSGEVLRNGIWMKPDVVHKMWRVARVLKVGPQVSSLVRPDCLIMYPSDKGLPMTHFSGKRIIFLNEPRIFAIVKRKADLDKENKLLEELVS